jgi:hypothetical protein
MVIKPSWLWTASLAAFDTPIQEGLAGVLVSPSRGLLIYSPIFLFSFVGMMMVWMDSKSILLKFLSLTPFLFVLFVAKWATWWGGDSYGPRLLADITPLLCLYLSPPLERAAQKTFLRYPFACLAALSIGFHAIGAFSCDGWPGHREQLWSWVDQPPGYYGWQVATAARQTFSRLKRMVFALPTSLNAPHRLAASYRLIGLIPEPTVFPSEVMIVQVRAHNGGEAVWLAHGNAHRGAVYLQSRWFSSDQEVPNMSAGEAIQYDVFPGQSYEFIASLTTPSAPGAYTLELGLVSAQMTWFSDQGTEPVKVGVRVLRPPSVDFDSVVAGQLKAMNNPPRVAIATDRSRYRQGEFLRLEVDFANPGRPLRVDAYLMLSWPQGWLSFHAANQRFWSPGGAWMPYLRRAFMPMGIQHAGLPIFTLQLAHMPPGYYTWFLILTEPATYHIIARAQASFVLEP